MFYYMEVGMINFNNKKARKKVAVVIVIVLVIAMVLPLLSVAFM